MSSRPPTPEDFEKMKAIADRTWPVPGVPLPKVVGAGGLRETDRRSEKKS